ncbi:hypothetical protein HQ590_11450 [bacterium]|nr:hypothetical protein [bacterium]
MAANPKIARWLAEAGPFELFIRYPGACQAALSLTNGDPFLAAFFAPAMVTGEPLRIAAAVSPRLLAGAAAVQSIYLCWQQSLSRVTIEASPRRFADAIPPGTRTGLFFSLGVDSFYSLFKNWRRHPVGDQAVDDLLLVHGLDIFVGKGNDPLFPAVHANAEQVAQTLGKRLVRISTNLRDFTDKLVAWGPLYHGAALASLALGLGSVYRQATIAATHSYDQLFPWGSHPVLDPLWSTESLTFIHDGCEARRVDKTRLIAEHPVALETLRVCFHNPENAYNCGCCEKCLRTMMGLHIVGALGRCQTLPHEIDPALVRAIQVTSENDASFLREVRDALTAAPTDAALGAALNDCLGRWRG